MDWELILKALDTSAQILSVLLTLWVLFRKPGSQQK
ncbi:hypothetical protein HNQ08_005068 [Deinococcus humi]|uniref:Holin n=1 Tax=Deinococcus humi TaxID=662880 RepID=A0A7W8NJA8_9DEIO|nr:hypothetical protein [Deinococcus humi]